MKISLFAYFSDLVNEKGINEAARQVSECGYTGVEFLYTEDSIPSVRVGEEYRAVLEEKRLAVPCVSCFASLVKDSSPLIPDKKSIEALKRCADFTHAIGAKYMHHTVYPCMNKSAALAYDDVIKAVLDGCSEVAEYAKGVGVTVLYEPQGLVFNGKCGFVNFYKEMKHLTGNVAVCFDAGNSYWVGEHPFPILEKIKQDVVHVHLKDYSPLLDGGGNPKEVALGDGSVNISELVKELLAIGYDGFFSVEDATDISIEEKYKRTAEIISR